MHHAEHARSACAGHRGQVAGLPGERFARQGYMYDAVKALVPFIFSTLGLHRIEAACLPSNDPSKNLLTKVGFRQEGLALRYLQINGEWRDHLLFALLADEVRLA